MTNLLLFSQSQLIYCVAEPFFCIVTVFVFSVFILNIFGWILLSTMHMNCIIWNHITRSSPNASALNGYAVVVPG